MDKLEISHFVTKEVAFHFMPTASPQQRGERQQVERNLQALYQDCPQALSKMP